MSQRNDASSARVEVQKLAGKLGELLVSGNWKQTTMIGPVPSFFAKLGGYYRWQIILRGPQPVSILREASVVRQLMDWRVEVDPISLL